MVELEKIVALVKKHEGFRALCYFDTRGYPTIGYGTNLDAAGASQRCYDAGLKWNELRAGKAITEAQAEALLMHDVQHAVDVALLVLPELLSMPENVQLVVTDMIYNLGSAGFLEFHHMIAALKARDWKLAAAAMMDSLWYEQTVTRAVDDVQLMLHAA